MALPVKIEDGGGSGQKVAVEDYALLTAQQPYPVHGVQKVRPFRQFITSDGLANGVSSMRVLGSLVSPMKFYVQADAVNDRYITALSFVIAGSLAAMNQFGAAVALTNGCRLYYTYGSGEVDIHTKLTSNYDFVRLCLGNPAFGTGADAFRAQNVVGLNEAFIPVLDLARLMPPYGLKLEAGTTHKLILSVRDDTSLATISEFNCIAYGFDRVP